MVIEELQLQAKECNRKFVKPSILLTFGICIAAAPLFINVVYPCSLPFDVEIVSSLLLITVSFISIFPYVDILKNHAPRCPNCSKILGATSKYVFEKLSETKCCPHCAEKIIDD